MNLKIYIQSFLLLATISAIAQNPDPHGTEDSAITGMISSKFSQEKINAKNIVYKTGNPANWPAELDAVLAAPKNHKIILENEKVRVLEVTLKPSEIEPLHHHRWPSVLYIQEAGDFTDADANGNIIFDSRKLPEPLTFPLTMYKEPEAPHSVVNLSDTKSIKLIRVELKH
ncbi:MAG: hypothetical protein CMC07_09390 [Flavobacteriaceae bacterium]|nr:hypothetical protein [Flavobacteriaceae bacterium]HBY69920.1 hypothetical protein [Flavobacteriaceae bacterium]|tara:strand:+ start:43980 stop:44492 length:513 start_codon:yes stop_codon:yes gene_type:complete